MLFPMGQGGSFSISLCQGLKLKIPEPDLCCLSVRYPEAAAVSERMTDFVVSQHIHLNFCSQTGFVIESSLSCALQSVF